MQMTKHHHNGAADFAILAEIAKFTNLTFFLRNLLRILQIFFNFCYGNNDTSSGRRIYFLTYYVVL